MSERSEQSLLLGMAKKKVHVSVPTITYERDDGFDINLVHRFLFSFSGMRWKMGMIAFTVSKWWPFTIFKLKY